MIEEMYACFFLSSEGISLLELRSDRTCILFFQTNQKQKPYASHMDSVGTLSCACMIDSFKWYSSTLHENAVLSIHIWLRFLVELSSRENEKMEILLFTR